jgi:DNA repair protein RecO (recombination protein O)
VGEADKVLTVLARDVGRISAWAKGARRLKSPLISTTQCFSFCDFNLFSTRDTYRISSAELIDNFFELRSDIVKLSLANYFAELACCVVLEGSSDNSVLSLTLNALHLTARTDKPAGLIKSVFELRLMQLAGYMPDIETCATCGEELREGWFDLSGGVMHCPECASDASGFLRVPAPVYRAIRHVLFSEAGKEFSFTLPEPHLSVLEDVCERFVVEHVDCGLRLWSSSKP